MFKYLLLLGAGYFIYRNYYHILKEVFYYYTKLNKSFKRIDYIKTNYDIILANTKLYNITMADGKEFLVKNRNIDTEKYNLLKSTFTIPHSPDDIFEATITTDKNETIDVERSCKCICGPFIDQITESNKLWIFEYLKHIKNLEDNIVVLKVDFINNTSVKLVLI